MQPKNKSKIRLPIKDIIVFVLLITNLALTGYFIYRFIDFKENQFSHAENNNSMRLYRLERATKIPSPPFEELQRTGGKCHFKETNQNGTMIHECK
jgi:hypothetical protein